jgi:hypothetical protein
MSLQEFRTPTLEWLVQRVDVGATAGLRFHDLRHHAITDLAESFVSDQTIMTIAGYVSRRMRKY